MSFSEDGQVHYYAHKGVADLTAEDHLMSSFPYGERCTTFNNFFFNVANMDNGQTWSTPWVIDDPKIYVIPPLGQQVTQLYRIKKQPQKQQVTKNQHSSSRVRMVSARRRDDRQPRCSRCRSSSGQTHDSERRGLSLRAGVQPMADRALGVPRAAVSR